MPAAINVDIGKITSFQTSLSELAKLEPLLASNQLDQFLVFNKAYIIVTKTIQQAADDSYFKNPPLIENLTACFAQYYFRAVNQAAANSPKLATAWAMIGQNKKPPGATANFILLLMGANAHINNDLPLALLEIIDGVNANQLAKDVLKIDRLLMRCGREILDSFEEPNQVLNFLKRRFVFLYYRPVMYMILYWRIKAWHNYKSIKKRGLAASDYANYSIRVARRFLRLALA